MRNTNLFPRLLVTLGMLVGLGMPSFAFAAVAPSITSIVPATGTTTGGTAVTINGTHLDSVTVTIGGSAATSVVIAPNGQSLTAVTPSGTAGAQDVVVANANGTSTLSGGFTYVAPVTIESCNGSTFDTFTNGSVNGQNGWHVSGDFDQEIVSNTFSWPTFGCKSLRISDATTSVFIYNQIFSASSTEAGETSAYDSNGATGTPNNEFVAQFDLASVVQNEQPGMHLSVSPDRGDGTRMSSLGFSDTASGIDVFFDDVTGTSTSATFNETQIATGLTRSVPHTFKFVMDFLEGASNDVVKIYIDGSLVHTGTSWENYYRYDSSVFGGPTPDNSRTVNSLVFYEPNPAHTANKWNGYLIDNLSISASATSTGTTTNAFPVITLNGSSTMNIDLDSTFTDPGATATDAEDGTLTVTATGTVNTSATGTYQIIYSATDSGNQTATTSRTVNVNATSTGTTTNAFPVITLNGSSTMNILLDSTWSDPGATATDAEDGALTVTATGTVNTAATGTYQIIYSATDSGNQTSTTTRTVHVNATSSLPIITLNGSSTVQVLLNTEFVDPGATATDAEDGTLTVTATGTVNTNALGTYTRTYTAIDSNNNTASTTRTINVVAGTATGGGGGSTSGGSYFVYAPQGGGAGQTTITPVTSTTNPITVTLLPPSSSGQVLGVSTYNFGRNLKFGMTGDDVLALQNLLKTGGYLMINVPTNYFGPKTLAALKKWQKAHKLPATGFFGPMSRTLLNNS